MVFKRLKCWKYCPLLRLLLVQWPLLSKCASLCVLTLMGENITFEHNPWCSEAIEDCHCILPLEDYFELARCTFHFSKSARSQRDGVRCVPRGVQNLQWFLFCRVVFIQVDPGTFIKPILRKDTGSDIWQTKRISQNFYKFLAIIYNHNKESRTQGWRMQCKEHEKPKLHQFYHTITENKVEEVTSKPKGPKGRAKSFKTMGRIVTTISTPNPNGQQEQLCSGAWQFPGNLH